jgi:hypothetical protein
VVRHRAGEVAAVLCVGEVELGQLLLLRAVERGQTGSPDLARDLARRIQRQRRQAVLAGGLEQGAVQREIETPALLVVGVDQELGFREATCHEAR